MAIVKFVLEYIIITIGVSVFKALGLLGLGALSWPAVFAVGLAWLVAAIVIAAFAALVDTVTQ